MNIMASANELKKLAERNRGIFRTAELNELGLSTYDIQKLIKTNVIERVKQGYYRFYSESDNMSEAAQIAQLFPDGVLCMYSALFFYAYSDRTPAAWDIAIDKNTSKSRFNLDYPYIQPYYLEPDLLTFGVTIAELDDCTMKIFDRDRLICECILYEKKMERETYNKAIQGYVADSKKSIPKLMEYAGKRRIPKKVKERIGVWL